MGTGTRRSAVVPGLTGGLLCATAASGQLSFTEAGDEVGLVAVHVPHEDGLVPLMWKTIGGATGDFNGDGWPDLFVIGGAVNRDKLFINNGDGTFTELGQAFGVGRYHHGSGVAVGDFDGDGWDDLSVLSYGGVGENLLPGNHLLYRNLGGEGFEEVGEAAGVNWAGDVTSGTSPAFGDYDLDGDLDLFVAAWVDWPGVNRLFRNEGDGTFTDVTEAAGMWFDGVRGYGPRFVDVTGDRLPDMLLAADFHTSQFLVNNGDGTFENVTQEAGVGADCNGMGAAVADFDGDGLLDWLVTAIYFEFGGPCGNVLYRNTGGAFEALGLESGLADAGWAWGAASDDLDNDGDIDAVVTGGWVSWPPSPTRVFLNDGRGHFEDVAQQTGLDHTAQGRGIVSWDPDRDGDRDITITSFDAPLRHYRNELNGSGGNWLALDIDTSQHPCLAPNGFGTMVEIDVAGTTRRRVVESGSNFASQSEATLHVGLGAAAQADEIRVEWHDGTTTVLRDVQAHQRVKILAAPEGDANGDGELDVFDFIAFQTMFTSGDPGADCNGDGALDIFDFICFQEAYSAGGCG